ncbi:MAG: 2-succinyl-6-hydroxy-2,4-cyclohexadiene-1-carboxylate synthase [Dehalococcoidia bacterium]|nr:2-succinyl-6-hydroxy-2,4-cyclohexadiene-1-carboxylate synthase [Dehalococcoidia bacterium]
MSRMAVNGIELNVEVTGEGPALLLLHGFTGDVSIWEPFVPRWSTFRIIRVDIIGHGGSDSPADASRYSMEDAVADLLGVLDQLGVEDFGVIGYSMGGRLALHLALAAPARIWGLVLEGASPGIEDEAERRKRVESDAELAQSIMTRGIESFVTRWQGQPLFASQVRLPAEVFERQRQQRLANNPLGLANSLRGMGAGSQEYLLPRLRTLRLPALLLAGAMDKAYSEWARRLEDELRDAVVEIIPGAGHAAHLEQPEYFSREVLGFLQRCLSRQRRKA